MFGDSRTVRGLTSRTWRALCATLVLGLSLGSPGLTLRAQAAPPARGADVVSDARYHLNIVRPPDPICAGRDYSIRVTPQVDGTVHRPGTQGTYSGISIPGVRIESTVADTRIGTLSPGSLISGFGDVVEAGDVPNEVTFSFHAKQVGATTLFFEALINHRHTLSGDDVYIGPGMPIKVMNCKYQVAVSSRWAVNYPNLNNLMVARTNGELVADANGNFNGTARVSYHMSSYSFMCSHAYTIPGATAQLTGDLDQDGNLMVRVKYNAVTGSSVNCASTSSAPVQPPQIEITMPPNGGSATQSQPFTVGALAMVGSVTITVKPIPAR